MQFTSARRNSVLWLNAAWVFLPAVAGCNNQLGAATGGTTSSRSGQDDVLLDPFAGFPGATRAELLPGPDADPEPAPEDVGWYLIAGSANTNVVMEMQVMPLKRFETLAPEIQAALLNVLDAGARGAFDEAFIQLDLDTGVLATGVGFSLQASPSHLQAYGLPALTLAPSEFAPPGIARNGPILAISRESLEALADLVGPVLGSSVAEARAPGAAQAQSQVQGLINDLDSFISTIEQDDASDGEISVAQSFSFTVPGELIDPFRPADDLLVEADLTFDLVQESNDADRWLGGVSADVTMTGTPDLTDPDNLTFEMAIGEQRIDNPDVVSLEPGSGAVSGGSRLQGEWLGSISIDDDLSQTLSLDVPASVEEGAFKAAVGSVQGWTLQRRLTQATLRLLAALTGAGPHRSDLAQVILPVPIDASGADDSGMIGAELIVGDTLYIKLVFDESGVWQDLLTASGFASATPEAEEFMSIRELFRPFDGELGQSLPELELRTSLTDEGQFRLDVLATDLFSALLDAATAPEGGTSDTLEPAIPDLSLLIIGGTLATDRLDGRVVVMLLVQDIEFSRVR